MDDAFVLSALRVHRIRESPDRAPVLFFAVRLTHIIVHVMFLTSSFTEGVFRRRSVGGAGRRRLQPWLVTTAQGAQSPSAPDEGAALSGWDSSDEGQRQCCPDNVSGLSPSVRRRSTVTASKIAAVERRKARVPVTRHAGAFAKVPNVTKRRSGAPPPSGRQKGETPSGRAGGRNKDFWRSARMRRAEPQACVRVQPFPGFSCGNEETI
jgi:hypothetical protein